MSWDWRRVFQHARWFFKVEDMDISLKTSFVARKEWGAIVVVAPCPPERYGYLFFINKSETPDVEQEIQKAFMGALQPVRMTDCDLESYLDWYLARYDWHQGDRQARAMYAWLAREDGYDLENKDPFEWRRKYEN